MEAKDLVKDKWYKFADNYIFKFERIENNEVYSYNFYLQISDKRYVNVETSFCNASLIRKYVIFEIDILDILYLLPSDNPDKINFLRKQRIDKLLKN